MGGWPARLGICFAVDRAGAGFFLLAAAICCGALRNHTTKALALWSVAALGGLGTMISMTNFSANERYVIPVMLPIIPIAGIWVADELKASAAAQTGPSPALT